MLYNLRELSWKSLQIFLVLSFNHHSTQTKHITILYAWAQTQITIQMYP